MTPKEQQRINDFMRKHRISHSSVMHQNCRRRHPAEGERHWKKKLEIADMIEKEGRPFWTEAVTISGNRRFDLLDPLGLGRIEVTYKGESHEDADEEFKCDKETFK